MSHCPHDCVTVDYRKLPITPRDFFQLLLLRRPVVCCDCGARYYRPMRAARRRVSIAATICLLIVGAVCIFVWRSNPVHVNSMKESLQRMLLRIR